MDIRWEDIEWGNTGEPTSPPPLQPKPKPQPKAQPIKPDREFVKEIQVRKRGSVQTKGIRRVVLIKPNQAPLVTKYLDSLHIPPKGFVYYEDFGYKRIANLRPNLLNEPYWVICTHTKGVKTFPPKYEYNEEVLEKYLNHIIITTNWSLLDQVDWETFSVNLEFNKTKYVYQLVFVSSMDNAILREYIEEHLSPTLHYQEVERITKLIMKDKKRIVEWVDLFLDMRGYSFEEVVETMKNESSQTINKLVRMLALKLRYDWSSLLTSLINIKGEAYVMTVLRNSVQDLIRLKRKSGKVSSLNKKYMSYYIQDVDSFNLLALENILECKQIEEVLLLLDLYMNNSTKYLIQRGGRHFGEYNLHLY